jgi:hypothetical protein
VAKWRQVGVFLQRAPSIEIFGTEGIILLTGVDIASRPSAESDFLRVYKLDGSVGNWRSSATTPAFKTAVFHEHVAWDFAKALR